jgi:oligoendopeptidase F
MVEDRLRSYPHWLAARNLANEASDESVQALIEAVARRFEVPRRWYRLKAQLLGLDRLADYDRMARSTRRGRQVGGATPRDSCSTSYGVLARARPIVAALLRRAVDRRAGAPEQARRRVLRLHGARAPPVRAAQLHRRAATC